MPVENFSLLNMDWLTPIDNHYSKLMIPQDSSDDDEEINILMVGASKVGKTAITVRYLTKRYIGEYYNLTDCRYKTNVTSPCHKKYNIELLDPGDRRNDTIEAVQKRIQWANGIIFVFSITDKKSFQEIQTLYNQVKSLKTYVPCVLIGNKLDLAYNRKVNSNEIIDLAETMNCTYYELSASVMELGYNRLCEAIHEVTELTFHRMNNIRKLSTGNRRRSLSFDNRIASGDERRRSLSPRPIRNAISRMFGGKNSREEKDSCILDEHDKKYRRKSIQIH